MINKCYSDTSIITCDIDQLLIILFSHSSKYTEYVPRELYNISIKSLSICGCFISCIHKNVKNLKGLEYLSIESNRDNLFKYFIKDNMTIKYLWISFDDKLRYGSFLKSNGYNSDSGGRIDKIGAMCVSYLFP